MIKKDLVLILVVILFSLQIPRGYSDFIYATGDYTIDAYSYAFFPDSIFTNDTRRNIEINCVTSTCRINFNITPVNENTTLIAEYKDFHSLDVNIDFENNGSYVYWFYNKENYQVRVLFTVKPVVSSSIDINLLIIGTGLIMGGLAFVIIIFYLKTRRKKELPLDYLLKKKEEL